jgi:hypothetical protein
LVLSKLTCPLPLGPPTALYVGKFPTPALSRVDIDAKEGLGVRAMNLPHAVFEYDATTFSKTVVHGIFFGLLFNPQQSCTVVVPSRDLNPAGQVWHTVDPVTF